jgi:hypothetical protein
MSEAKPLDDLIETYHRVKDDEQARAEKLAELYDLANENGDWYTADQYAADAADGRREDLDALLGAVAYYVLAE